MSNVLNTKYARLVSYAVIITIIVFSGFSVISNISPASAATDTSRWAKVNIPADGESGGWALANGSDIRHLTITADGTLYAYAAGLSYTLLRSTDGGLRWTAIGKVQDAIIDIAVSPQDPNTIYYATTSSIHRSIDGGKNFILLPSPGGAGAGNIVITSIAVQWLNGSIIVAGTRDSDAVQYGGVYIFEETAVIPAWTDTGIGNYDVFDIAFSPGYAADRQIIAVATDEINTWVYNKVSNAGWNAFIGAAKLNRNNAEVPAALVTEHSAAIAFADGYTAQTGTPECTLFVGIDSGSGLGDVYKIIPADAPAVSVALDLNAGAVSGANDIDISGLAVCTYNGAPVLLAGAANDTRTFFSADGGINWSKGKKLPTGAGDTCVAFSPDFSTTGMMFAATNGSGSALSVSRDTGITWNQISLIDTAINNIVDMTPSPEYSLDNTLFMITFGAGPGSGALWRTINGGSAWERTLCGSNPNVQTISRIGLPPHYGALCKTVFAAGESSSNPAIMVSDDNGQSYRIYATHNPTNGASFPIDTWAVIDEKTLLIGSFDGAEGLVYRTLNKGFSFSEGVPAGGNSLYSIAVSPDYLNDGTILAGNTNGGIYKSTDGGASFLALPNVTAAATLTGSIAVAFDPAYKDNGKVFISSNTINTGFYRFDAEVSEEWEKIDSTLPAGSVIGNLVISANGVLYGVNSIAGKGIERCLNARVQSPVFETVTAGLSANTTLNGLRLVGSRLWAIDTTNNRLMTYNDTLTAPVILTSPENGVSGIGGLNDHAVKSITIDWAVVDGATGYEWQCAYKDDFSSIPAGLQGTVTGSSVHLPPLDPATSYCWRVRVSAPALSPWSEKRAFTTSLDTQVVELKPESPAAGAIGVSIRPVFQWTALVGASSYELLVADDAEFDNPVIIKMNDYALTSNAWECDVSLDYDTTYYWKVRAITASTHSTWSSSGVFTTEVSAAPLPTAPEGQPEVRLLDGQDPMMNLAPPRNMAPLFTSPTGQLLPPPASAVPASVAPATGVSQVPVIPGYFAGGLLAIVMLALVIILAVVLKIRRF